MSEAEDLSKFAAPEPQLWLPGQDLPDFVVEPEAYFLAAHNSGFEYAIWHECMKWPVAPIDLWIDSMAMTCSWGLPRALGQAAEAIGLPPDKSKDKRGKQLIQQLSRPVRGKRNRDPELLEEMYLYCVQDVVTQMAIRDYFPISVWNMFSNKKIVDFDYETYSECDLKNTGLGPYARHPSTEVLCMAYCVREYNALEKRWVQVEY